MSVLARASAEACHILAQCAVRHQSQSVASSDEDHLTFTTTAAAAGADRRLQDDVISDAVNKHLILDDDIFTAPSRRQPSRRLRQLRPFAFVVGVQVSRLLDISRRRYACPAVNQNKAGSRLRLLACHRVFLT